MKWIFAIAASACLLTAPAAIAADDIGCFSDGDFVYLHVGSTYQYYVSQGDRPVECTADAVKLGLELTDEAVRISCGPPPTAVCEEEQRHAQLIRDTYGDLLGDAAAESAAAVEPQAGTPDLTEPPAEWKASDAAGQPVPVAPPAVVDSPDMVRWVQTSLQQLGYKPGAADGEMGSRTAAAIRRYEEDNSLPVTGKMSVVLVDSLKQRTQP
jgi:hypothetical protein